ncbi:MAG: 4Fe-4S dicluster domain-containing protein [Candidatus Lokiarchaeota archaeon]|nr:4Fe-4S dicluster domain-containing protein [Candidatus Lokiarchaeota archaeon]
MDLYLVFDSEKSREPIISKIVMQSGIKINILSVSMNELGGTALISVPDEHAEKVKTLLEAEGIFVNPKRMIEIDRDLCIDCGACVSLCGVKALKYGDDFSIEFDEDKCVYCLLCMDACPRFAIKSTEAKLMEQF